MADTVNAAFATLSPEQRAVVELTYYHGMHYREIGRIVDCPENTVKTRMYHARRKLAAALAALRANDAVLFVEPTLGSGTPSAGTARR